MIKYRERYLAVVTYHQIKGFDPERIGIRVENSVSFLTAGGLVWDRMAEHPMPDDQHDIAVLDFTSSVLSGDISPGNFYDGFGLEYLRPGERVLAGIVVGFAASDQQDDSVDHDEHGQFLVHSYVRKRIVVGKYTGDAYQPEIFRIEDRSSSDHDFDGFSGSPVFFLCGDAANYSLKLGGFVIRAGNGHFYCLKHTRLRRMLEESFQN